MSINFKMRNFRLFILILLFCGINPLFGQLHNVADSGYIQSFDGTKIYYEAYGKGYPVLLIHGFIVNSNSWKNTALMDSLITYGYKVVLIDMRGNGKSDKPHTDSAYENDAEAKDIMQLMKHVNVNEYNIVGYSRGSIIATRLLLLDNHVHKAVIGGMGTDFLNPEWPRRLMFYHALEYDTVPSLHALVKHTEQPGFDRKALALLQKHQPSADAADLKRINTPVLVIKGSDDIYSNTAKQFASLFPHGKFIVTPGDHDHAAATANFASATLKFFNEQP